MIRRKKINFFCSNRWKIYFGKQSNHTKYSKLIYWEPKIFLYCWSDHIQILIFFRSLPFHAIFFIIFSYSLTSSISPTSILSWSLQLDAHSFIYLIYFHRCYSQSTANSQYVNVCRVLSECLSKHLGASYHFKQ